jgi:hypothetical protein
MDYNVFIEVAVTLTTGYHDGLIGGGYYPYWVERQDWGQIHFGLYNPAREEQILWCMENFGNQWIATLNRFYFKNAPDRSMFILKWA